MAITNQVNHGITSNSRTTVSGSISTTGGTQITLDQVIPASSTNLLASIAFTAANVQSFILLSTTNLTIKTNSSGSPANTLSLLAGMPFVWEASSGYFANPFTTNVTAFYYTNGTAATSLTGWILTS